MKYLLNLKHFCLEKIFLMAFLGFFLSGSLFAQSPIVVKLNSTPVLNYDFGNVIVGNSSGVAPLSVENIDPQFTLSNVKIEGADANMFLTSYYFNYGQNAYFDAYFQPTSLGNKTASITLLYKHIVSNVEQAPYTFAVTGTGLAVPLPIEIKQATTPVLNAVGTYNFGNVNLNSNTKNAFFTVNNIDFSNLALTNFQINGADAAMFSTVSWANSNVGSGLNTNFDLRFTPNGAGSKTAFVTVDYNFTTFTNKLVSNSATFGENDLTCVHGSGNIICVGTSMNGIAFSTDGGNNFVRRTTAHGLGSNQVFAVHVANGKIYVGTDNGLAFSTDGGNSFFNKDAGTLGGDFIYGISVSNGIIYTASDDLSFSTDGGYTFAKKVAANGYNNAGSVYIDNGKIYVGTRMGLYFSTDGGNTILERNSTHGVQPGGGSLNNGVYVSGLNVYVATGSGLSFSTDGGYSFRSKIVTAPLEYAKMSSVYVSDGVIYAGSINGLAISADGGNTFTNKTRVNGLGSSVVKGVFPVGNKIYVATQNGLSFSTVGTASYTFTVFATVDAPTINLKEGTNNIANNSGQIQFTSANVGSPTQKTNIRIENLGTANLNFTGFQISGANANLFSTVFTSTNVVSTGNSITFDLNYTPNSIGLHEAFITIYSNDLTKNPYIFKVSGYGKPTNPDILLKQGNNSIDNATNYAFANQTVGTSSANIDFTIQNTGTANLNLTSNPKIIISGANANDFLLMQTATLSSIAPNGSTYFSVRFSPASIGTKTATISILNNVIGKNPYVFTLTGNALALATANPPLITVNPPSPPVVVASIILNINGLDIPILAEGSQFVLLTTACMKVGESVWKTKMPSNVQLYLLSGNSVSVQNNIVTPIRAGESWLNFVKVENGNIVRGNYLKVCVEGAKNTITVFNMPNLTCNSGLVGISAVSTSGQMPIISFVSGNISIENNQIRPTGTGKATIRLSVLGNEFYLPASINLTFDIAKANRIFSLQNPADRTFGNADFDLPLTFNGEKIIYTPLSNLVEITGNRVKIKGAGSNIQIKAQILANACFNESVIYLTLNVKKASQNIIFPSISDRKVTDPAFALQASSPLNLPIIYQVLEGQNLISLQGNMIKINGIGRVRVQAYQAGNENYLPTYAEQTFNIYNNANILAKSMIVDMAKRSLIIDFASTGIFGLSNQFTAVLSDANGSFNYFSQQISGSFSNGQIVMSIPNNITRSSNYRVKILASSPSLESNVLQVPAILFPMFTQPTYTIKSLTICMIYPNYRYRWYCNGRLLVGYTSSCITVSYLHYGRAEDETDLVYTAVAIDEEGNESEMSAPITFTRKQIAEANAVTATESELEQNPIRVYPNPVRDRLVLDLSSKFLRKIEISVFNMLGQKVFEKSFANSQKEEVLDLNHLPAGTYLLEISSDQGKHRQQIVKE